MSRRRLVQQMLEAVLVTLLLSACTTQLTPRPAPTLVSPTLVSLTAVPPSQTAISKSPTSKATPSATPSASQAKPTPPKLQGISQPLRGKYLFVEFSVFVDAGGNLAGGSVNPFAVYSFDSRTGELRPPANIGVRGKGLSLAPSEWGFIGNTMQRGSSGGMVSVETIATIPYTAFLSVFTGSMNGSQENMRNVPVKLLAISADGKLAADIDGEQVVLDPGKFWQRAVKADKATADKYEGYYAVYSQVRNYGWYDRAQIKSRAYSP